MELSNEIVLRPRFKFNVNSNNEKLLKGFETTKTNQSEFIVSRIDDHVFIKFPKSEQHFWSPQLHLEINKKDDKNSTVHGLFGPNPTVWTMFMFFHFIVAGLFLGFGVWAYTNATLNSSYSIQLLLAVLMVVIWFILYFTGRLGQTKGKPEMHRLHNFMKNTLSIYR
ncbi:GTP-binding protein [Winogradskyella echinorum]|uniref:GTP-binding protein n=1 Tax=Winogradskyella echinorum TaxID=538189 RepID=A0ABR6Y3V2_9FLAO|nr:GTP-binding protein [Winogradskyella echinorum]MBC3847354.1 GTP-binding protein [Winogradskyella echinorum]MBC5751702.1 GTP-binding protein [Winogradskyella echinorum]